MTGARHRILSARVPLWPDEPAYGLANRLARRNGVSSLVAFAGDHAIPHLEIIRGRRNAEIADLSGAETNVLNAATFRVDGERVHLNDEVLHIEDWSYTSLRVCPSCVRSDLERDDSRKQFLPHLRSWWNLPAISVCPIHRQVLLDRHPDCPDAQVNHLSLDVRFVAQGRGDFATISTEPVDDVRAEAYLLGRLRFMPRIHNTLLDGLPLWNTIRLMDRIGAVAASGPRGFTSFGGEVPKRDALAAGYAVFADGAAGFSSFLDSLVAVADVERGKWGLRVPYGRIYEWLSHDNRDAIYDPIRELIREHAIDNIPMGPDDLVFGKSVGTRRVYTLWHVSKAINTKPSSARRILRALGHLSPADDAKENWQIIFKAPIVELVKSAIEDWMNLSEARIYLGVPRAQLYNLLDAGLIKPFLHVSTGVAEHMFRKRDLDVLVANLIGSAPVCKKPSATLCNIIIAGKRSQTSTVDVVSALMDGRLKCRGYLGSETGLMRILVDLEEVKAIQSANIPAPSGLSIDVCRRRLGITWPVISSLVRLGYFRITQALRSKNRKRTMIDEDSFQEFVATYISAAEVAASRKTNVRALVPKLRQSKIEPAITNSAAGQYFYRRSDLVACLDKPS